MPLSRQQLYEKVWAEPVQRVAESMGISDVALAKGCKRHQIPVPGRGYWSTLQAGKRVDRLPLATRALGQLDFVYVGDRGSTFEQESDAETLSTSIPPVPTFEPAIQTVRLQVEALARRAPPPLRKSRSL
jgi:hypothetical protein